MTLKPELITFATADGFELPGLLYEPKRRTRTAAIYLHGNGSSSVFYNKTKMEAIAGHLNAAGVVFMPFNNRGAHYIKRLKRIRRGVRRDAKMGMAYERIKDCIKDIDGAVKFLRRRGYRALYLIGESSGANKICVYNFYRPRNSLKGYVLLSGGDDTGLYYTMLGARRFPGVLELCRRKIKAKQGRQLVPSKITPFIISYQSLYDTMNPNGDYNTFPFFEALSGVRLSRRPLFRHFRSIRKPSLVLYGSEDQFCYGDVPGCVRTLQEYAAAPKNFAFKILVGAGHSFAGYEGRLGQVIAKWLRK